MKNLLKKIKSMWSTPLDGRYLTFKEILAFGGSSLGYSFIINIIWAVITVSQISEIYQISVLHGPIIFVIASVIGLIAQPVFGKVLQRTKTRIGKYKPFILILAPLISVCAIAFTWLPQNLTETNKLIYVYCTSIPTLVMWNLFNNTFQMLPAVITPNQQERTDVWSPIGLIVGFAPTVINVIKGWVIGYFTRQGNAYLAYRYMGLISIVFGLALVLLILKVRERVYVTEEESKNEKVGLFEGLKLVMKNKPLMVLSL
ncbi:MAG: MFS transporter, partial [Clostridia bacterium]